MNIYDLKISRTFIKRVAVLGAIAARKFPKANNAVIGNAVADTLEDMVVVVMKDGSTHIVGKNISNRVKPEGGAK